MSDEEPAYPLQEGESLKENILFQELKKHPDFFGVACGSGILFCAPRSSTITQVDRSTLGTLLYCSWIFLISFILASHILQPKDDKGTYYTLDGRVVMLRSGYLQTSDGTRVLSRTFRSFCLTCSVQDSLLGRVFVSFPKKHTTPVKTSGLCGFCL